MKRILVVGANYLYYTKAYIEGIKKSDNDIHVDVVYIDCFSRNNLDIKEYIKYKLNKKRYIKNYYSNIINKIKCLVVKNRYDEFYSISANIYYECIDTNLLKQLKAMGAKRKAIYIDTVKRFRENEQHLDLFDKVFSLESRDINYMKSKNINNTFYMPVGASDVIYSSKKYVEEKINDICFVGGYSEYRAELCEKIAMFCINNNIKFVVYGPYWENSKIFGAFLTSRQETRFSKRYPNLYKCIVNRTLTGEEVATLYKRSKICLNIHIPVHLGLNARVFEISASPNFQLCDTREDFSKLGFKDGENIVVYKDADDCIDKIKYYLSKDDLRRNIAKKGNQLVLSKYTMSKLMAKTLDDNYRGEF